MQTFGERLKKYREDVLHKSQDDLAKVFKISSKTISSWEVNRTEPEFEHLKWFYKQGCDLNWLIGGDEALEREEIKDLRKKFIEMEKGRDDVRKDILDALARCENKLNQKKAGPP